MVPPGLPTSIAKDDARAALEDTRARVANEQARALTALDMASPRLTLARPKRRPRAASVAGREVATSSRGVSRMSWVSRPGQMPSRRRATVRRHARQPARAPVAADPAPRAQPLRPGARCAGRRARLRTPDRVPRPRRADAGGLPGRLGEARRPCALPLPRHLPSRRRALHAGRDPGACLRRGPPARARGHRLPRLDPLGAREDPRRARARADGVPRTARRVVSRAAGPAQE